MITVLLLEFKHYTLELIEKSTFTCFLAGTTARRP